MDSCRGGVGIKNMTKNREQNEGTVFTRGIDFLEGCAPNSVVEFSFFGRRASVVYRSDCFHLGKESVGSIPNALVFFVGIV